jgi:HAD superfamily hydrolase (TIGR01509 family)
MMPSFVFLFDLDGTLVETHRIYFKIWSIILSQYNVVLTPEIFNTHIIGRTNETIAATLLPTGCNIADITKQKTDLFMDNLSEIQLVKGARDFIQTIKSQGHSCSIVSNGNRELVEKIVEFCQLREYMDYITIGGECGRPKPHPDPYLETIQKYNLPNDNFIIFEDSKPGVLSAQLSNVRCVVGVETNYDPITLIQNGADITIPNYTQIDEILYRI